MHTPKSMRHNILKFGFFYESLLSIKLEMNDYCLYQIVLLYKQISERAGQKIKLLMFQVGVEIL